LSLFAELKRRNVFKVGIAYIVMAWLVMQVADVILNNIEAPGWVFRVILLLLGIGFLIAMFFAWAFEMTPEGLKREHEVDRSQSITPQTGRKLNNLIFAFMALALAYFAYDKFVLSSGRETAAIESAVEVATSRVMNEQTANEEASTEPDNSIAVLPFADMSPNKDQDYFSDGLSEELLNLLAKIPELRVAARTSSFSFKDQNLEIPEIAERLKVAHVLEGSVRTAGNQIRVTAQLIKADDGYHMWSETFDRNLDNVFAIQDEIAAEVVKQLKVTLLGAVPTAFKIDPEAYALYLQARHLSRMGTDEALSQAILQYEQVLTIDPTYAEAWAELGRAQINQSGLNLASEEIAFAQGRESLNRALEIDPDNAAAHSRMGWIAMAQGKLEEAARHMRFALRLEPGSAAALGNAAQFLQTLGRHEQSVRYHKKVASLDPASALSHVNLSDSLYYAGRLEEALAAAQTAERLSPAYWGVSYAIGNIYLKRQDFEAALTAFTREGDEEYRTRGTAMAFFSLGRNEEFEAALSQLQDGWGHKWPSEVAAVFVWAGDFDAAFEWLDKTIQVGDTQIASFINDPLLVGIQEDARWMPFLESIGKSPEQLAAIEFNVTMPE
jgi:TolB-like protein/Flp pilus assembly protein TadD